MYAIYPEVKEKYGMNRILEKIFSFFWTDTDYDHEKKKILDNYYKNKRKIKWMMMKLKKSKIDYMIYI